MIQTRPSMRSVRFLVSSALLALLVVGCSRLSLMPLHQELQSPGRAWQSSEGKSVIGFITNDGEFHRFRGWVKLDGDSLVFHGSPSKNEYGEATHHIAVSEVSTVLGKEFDRAQFMSGTAAVLVNIAVVVGVLWLAVGLVAGGGLAGN